MSDFAVVRTDEPIKDDYTWAASKHGMHTGFGATLNVSAFTAGTHYPNGYVPSGTPVRKVGTKWEPTVADSGATYDAIVLEPVAIREGQTDAIAAVVDHIIVHADRLRGAAAGAAPAATSGIVAR